MIFGNCKSFFVPIEYFQNFTFVQLYGVEFRVPARYIEYLEYWYSSSWRTPQKDWNILDSPGCLVTKVGKYDKYIKKVDKLP